ncbi:hypothetical protein Trydic_g18288 [Trypoxylus dichotomus]
MEYQQEGLSSCIFATQGNEVFDIEDFGSFSPTAPYRNAKRHDDFQIHHDQQQLDYSNMQYFDSDEYSPNSIGETNMFNFCNVPSAMYNDDQTCPLEYELFGQYDTDDNQPRIVCPVRPNGLLARLPCKTNENWNYNQCFSYYANGCYNTCQFVDVIDIEDFMNNEKRKEKSREAARCRRSRETEIFNDISQVLPLSPQQIGQLDKASIMRLAISYLRVREMVDIESEKKSIETYNIKELMYPKKDFLCGRCYSPSIL